MTDLSKLGTDLNPLVWNGIIIVLSLILGVLLKVILQKILSWYTKHHDYFLFKSIVKNLETPFIFLIPLIIINFSIDLLRIEDKTIISKGVELALLGAFAFVLTGIVRVVEEQIYYKNDLSKSDNLKARKIRTQIEFISRIITVLIIMVTIAAMLLSFENLRKIGTGLLAGVGVGSIIIGFAAQSSLSNLLAGFQIAFTQPIRIDDVVVLEGEWGRIEDITLTYVVVKIWDERRLILPIRYFIEKPFQNWTRVTSEILGTVFLYMDYTVPVDKLREKFDELLNASSLWDKKVKVIQVTDAKENTIEVRALMSSRNSSESFDLRCHIRENLISFIQTSYPNSLPKNRTEISGLDKIAKGLQLPLR